MKEQLHLTKEEEDQIEEALTRHLYTYSKDINVDESPYLSDDSLSSPL